MTLHLCGMDSIEKIDPSLLTGTWRLAKIQWHDKKVTDFTASDNWLCQAIPPMRPGKNQKGVSHKMRTPFFVFSKKKNENRVVSQFDTLAEECQAEPFLRQDKLCRSPFASSPFDYAQGAKLRNNRE